MKKTLRFFWTAEDGAPASLFQRLAARVVDAVIVLSVLFVLVVTQIFWFMDDLSDSHQPEPWGRSFVASVSFVVLYVIYESVFHTYNRGQTPGKMALSISLKSVSREGGGEHTAPHLWQSFFRTAGPVVPLLFFEPWPWQISLIILAMGLPALFDFREQPRALHDFLVGTCVVYREPTSEDEEFIRTEKELRRERIEKYGWGFFRQIGKRDKNIEDE